MKLPWLMITALLGTSGVILGAAGSHLIDPDQTTKNLFEIALRYQMWHVFALLGLSAVCGAGRDHTRTLDAGGLLILIGMLCFSGSLYFRVFVGELVFPWITPLGGMFLIAGWLSLAIAGWKMWRSA